MKGETTKLSVTIPSEIIKKINDGDYNRSKLIIRLLRKYFKKDEK